MPTHTRLWLLCAFATLIAGQTIIPTSSSATFPGCALSCVVLRGAQDACSPPSVSESTQLTYDNCFCQYFTLQGLYSTPDSVCAGECSIESDRQLLRTWFINFCQQVGKGIDPVASTSAATTTVVGTTTGTSNQATGAITFSPAPNHSPSANNGPSWFSTHWKWVVMVIVLFISFLVIALAGIWFKRRHKRKAEEKIARRSGFPMTENKAGGPKSAGATSDLWGPHQHMAASLGYRYPRGDTSAADAVAGKSSDKNSLSKNKVGNVKVDEIKAENFILPALSKSSRPRPSELDVDLRAAEAERKRGERQNAQEKNRKRDRVVEKGLQGLNRKGDRPNDEE